jgi:hypothetical protein
MSPAPTINDLRTKHCYICLETEQEPNPSTTWTHPCKCTLIAHESCLLSWIQSAQSQNQNPLQCPQCKTPYQLESDVGGLLKIIAKGLEKGNRIAGYGGLVFLAVVIPTGVVTSVSVGTGWMLARYGVWAVKMFYGEEYVFHLQVFFFSNTKNTLLPASSTSSSPPTRLGHGPPTSTSPSSLSPSSQLNSSHLHLNTLQQPFFR